MYIQIIKFDSWVPLYDWSVKSLGRKSANAIESSYTLYKYNQCSNENIPICIQ